MANDNITIKIKAINEAEGSIESLNNQLDESVNKSKTLSNSLNNAGSGIGAMKTAASATSGVLATLSITDFLAQIIDSNTQFNNMRAKIIGMSSDIAKATKDFETLTNFKGISRFDTQDIQEVYNILKSQNIEITNDILETISDMSLATSQNITVVAEQYRSVLNGEVGSLDDYFKSVVKTSEGIAAQYTSKSGELKTIMLNDTEALTNAYKDRAGGLTKVMNDTANGQLLIYKEKFFNQMNILSDEMVKLFVRDLKSMERVWNLFSKNEFKTDIEINKETIKESEIEKLNYFNERLKKFNDLKKESNLNTIQKDDFVALFESLKYGEKEYNLLNEEQKKYFENSNVINNINSQNKQKQDDLNKSLEGSLTLYKDLNKQLKEIKDIKGVDSFLSNLDKNQKNVLSSNLELLKQDAEKQKQLITNLENEKIDIKIKKMNLETRVLKGDTQAKIELIKLNSLEEIRNLTETGDKRISLEKSILSRQSVEIDNFNKDLLEKEKEKNEKLEKLNKERLEKQIELNNKLNKLNEEISILKVNNNNDLNQFEKENIINKRNLLARQRDELNVKDLTNEEKKLLEEKHLLEIESLEKESLDRRKRLELESRQNVLDMKLRNKDSLSNSLNQQGLSGETGANLNDLANNLDTNALDETRNLKLEQTKLFYDQEIQAARDRNASLEEINLLQAEKDKSIVDIQQQYTLGSLENMQSSLTSFQGILSNLSTLVGGENKKMFRIQQGVQIAQAVMNTGLGITRALAEGGPYLGPVLAGVIGAMGFAQVAQISAQKPKYHDGGMIKNGGKLSNEIDATLQTGEGVLSRRGMNALDRLNRGDSMNNNYNSNGNNNIYLDKDKMIESILKDRTFKNNVKSMTSN